MARHSFERTVAFRYLLGVRGRNRGERFLRFVIVVAISGVMVGTAALLVALAIVRGFSLEIEEKVVGFGQHVQVESYTGDPLRGADSLSMRLAGFEGVERVTPAIIEFALLRAKGEQGPAEIDGVLLWGTPPDGQPFVASNIVGGEFSFALDSLGHPGLVLGDDLARRLGVQEGSLLTAFSTRALRTGSPTGSRPKVRQFRVRGVYDTGLADFDARFAYLDFQEAQGFFEYGLNEVGRFDIVLEDIEQSPSLAETISREVGPPIFARSIYDIFRHLFAWVNLQQGIIPIVISVLVLVAAFNIIGTLLMMILDKTREIGILLGMGASRKAIRGLFVWLGFFIGVVGSVLGAVFALGFSWIQLEFGVIPLPPDAYYIDTAPIQLHALDFVVVPVVAILMCTLAAYLPARAAARIEPIRSIRFGG